MSLINQMLRDLEKRKADAESPAPWPQGIQIVDDYPEAPRRWPWLIAVVAGTAVLVAGGWYYRVAIDDAEPVPVVAVTPSSPVPVTAPHSGVGSPEAESPLPLGEGRVNEQAPMPMPAAPVAAPLPASLPGREGLTVASQANPTASVENSSEVLRPDEKPAATVKTPLKPEPPKPTPGGHVAPASPPARKPDSKLPSPVPRSPARPAPAAVSGGGDSAVTLYRRGALAMEEGYVARAMSDLERALALQPNHREARLLLLRAYATYGDYGRASELLENHPELRADPIVARLQAQMLLKQGQTEQAEQALEQAGLSTREDVESLGVRGALKQRQGKHREAAELYRKAVTLQPNQSKWWLGLAISLEAGERYEEALQAYQRTMDLGALSSDVRSYVVQRLGVLRGQH